ncbi:MAG: DMT family transporter [Acidimicrobiales bacterium]
MHSHVPVADVGVRTIRGDDHRLCDGVMSPRASGVGLIAVSAASFGAMAIFARLAYDGGADITAVLFLRFAIAAPCMAVLLRLRGQPWPRGRVLAGLVAMGGIGYVGQSLSYFTALTLASASLVALLLYAYPAIVTVLSAVLFGVRLTPVRIGAPVLALAGTGGIPRRRRGGGRLPVVW